MDAVSLGTKVIRYTSEDYIEVELWHEQNIDISGATVTFDLYDSTGTIIVTAAAMTITGTKRARASYKLTTGSGKTLSTNPGVGLTTNYIGYVTCDYSTQQPKKVWQIDIKLKGKPG